MEESEVADAVSGQYGVPTIELDDFEVDAEVIALIPEDVAQQAHDPAGEPRGLDADHRDVGPVEHLRDRRHQVPHRLQRRGRGRGRRVDPARDRALLRQGRRTSTRSWPASTTATSRSSAATTAPNLEELEKAVEDAPVVKLANLILTDAIKKNASDIHVEPYEKDFRVRYRIDGVLYEVMRPPRKLRNPLTSRIKIMADLDIAERRLPQDGRIKLKMGKTKEMDYRVSVLPTLFGEKIVMRLLDKGNLQLDMTKLGFEEKQLDDFKDVDPPAVRHGAGHRPDRLRQDDDAVLRALRAEQDHARTSPPPRTRSSSTSTGINQVQMKEDIGLNFAAALRAFLRQDPDIIMVGEIRDFETAEIAIKAALTGHMVLSTLHTNDAPEHDQPLAQHGHRAVPGRELGQLRSSRSASRGASVRSASRTTRPSRSEELEAGGPDAGRGGEVPARQGRRLRQLLGDRLQGPHRGLRSHGC